MASFTPILSNQPLSYAFNKPSCFRNTYREDQFGSPVYFVPPEGWTGYGEGGPKYRWGYNYDNSPSTYLGNCTWWCLGRMLDCGYVGDVQFTITDAKNWYDRYDGSKDTNINNLQEGDVIVFETNSDPSLEGHVMFVEQISGTNVTISESAYSQRSVWVDKSCLVTTYTKTQLSYGAIVDMYKDLDSPYYERVIGYIHTNERMPSPPPTPSLDIGTYYRALFRKIRRRLQHVSIN